MTTKKLYTSISKGGEYEFVGTSHGAGGLKGIPLIVYRDTTSGKLHHREPEEFATRMKAIEPKPLADDLRNEILDMLSAYELRIGVDLDIAVDHHGTALVQRELARRALVAKLQAGKAGA